jgi:hypothetical protein
MIGLFVLSLFIPQADSLFPAQIVRGHAASAVVYPAYGFVIWEGATQQDIMTMNQVLADHNLVKVDPQDTSNHFNSHPRGAWLEKANGPNLTARFWTDLQSVLPKKIFVAPTYVIRPAVRNRAFVPVPNVLIVDSAAMTNSLQSELSAHGLTFDSQRSQLLTGRAVFRSERENTILLREVLIKKVPADPALPQQLRFENIPLERDDLHTDFALLCPSHDWNLQMINASPPPAMGSNSVRVAVLDFGVDMDHSDLNISPGINLNDPTASAGTTDISHGTWLAGVIGARDDGNGVTGLASGVEIVPVTRVTGSDLEIANGIKYCSDNDIDILCMGFGRTQDWRLALSGWDYILLDTEIEAAFSAGVLLVASAGNDSGPIAYPARHPKVMAVGATGKDDRRMAYSNNGDATWNGVPIGISVMAPGDDICTTTVGGSYNTFDKTSSAAPHVAGLAALLKSHDPSLTGANLRSLIESTTFKDPTLSYSVSTGYSSETRNPETGYGRINVRSAYRQVAGYWPGVIHSIEFAGISKDIIELRAQLIRLLIRDFQLAQDCVHVIVVRADRAIGYRNLRFSTEDALRLTSPRRSESEDGLTALTFEFDPKQLPEPDSDAKWQVIAVTYEGNFASEDLRQAIASGQRNVAVLEFRLDKPWSPLRIALIVLGLMLLGVLIYYWIGKASAEKAQVRTRP